MTNPNNMITSINPLPLPPLQEPNNRHSQIQSNNNNIPPEHQQSAPSIQQEPPWGKDILPMSKQRIFRVGSVEGERDRGEDHSGHVLHFVGGEGVEGEWGG